jgi:hypothetical protein
MYRIRDICYNFRTITEEVTRVKDWTCQEVLKKKRHEHANQLQLLLGYEQMQKKEKVAEIIADWMQQLEVERHILSLPFEKTSVVLAYYQSDLALSVGRLSLDDALPVEAIDDAMAEAVGEVLAFIVKYKGLIQALHVYFDAVTDTYVRIHYRGTLKSHTGDIIQTPLNTQPFEIEVTSKEIIMKQHVSVNNKENRLKKR